MCYAKNGVRGQVTGVVFTCVRGFEYWRPAAALLKSYGLG